MKNLRLSSCALTVCVATILSGGCGGSQEPIAASGFNAMNPGPLRTEPLGGGSFSAGYSGSDAFEGGILCDSDFDFSGNGKASFLRDSSEQGSAVGCPITGFRGKATITSKSDSSDTIRVSLAGGSYDTMTFKITRGTGKFAHATGNGMVTLASKPRKCRGVEPPEVQCGHYTDRWTGMIHY